MHNFNLLQDYVPNVSRETYQKILQYEELLKAWQDKLNLISNNDIDIIWQRHILDSCQLYPYIMSYNNIIDIGSGAGFPAIILAILSENNIDITLVEKSKKKCNFLSTVVEQLSLTAKVKNIRIEDYIKDIDNRKTVITARAFANLNNICQIIYPILLQNSDNIALLPKGENHKIEIDQASLNWHFDIEKIQSKLKNNSVILKIKNLKKRR